MTRTLSGCCCARTVPSVPSCSIHLLDRFSNLFCIVYDFLSLSLSLQFPFWIFVYIFFFSFFLFRPSKYSISFSNYSLLKIRSIYLIILYYYYGYNYFNLFILFIYFFFFSIHFPSRFISYFFSTLECYLFVPLARR